MWHLRSQKDIWALKISPEELEVPASHWASQTESPVPEKEVSTTSGCENKKQFHWVGMGGGLGVLVSLFKGLVYKLP